MRNARALDTPRRSVHVRPATSVTSSRTVSTEISPTRRRRHDPGLGAGDDARPPSSSAARSVALPPRRLQLPCSSTTQRSAVCRAISYLDCASSRRGPFPGRVRSLALRGRLLAQVGLLVRFVRQVQTAERLVELVLRRLIVLVRVQLCGSELTIRENRARASRARRLGVAPPRAPQPESASCARRTARKGGAQTISPRRCLERYVSARDNLTCSARLRNTNDFAPSKCIATNPATIGEMLNMTTKPTRMLMNSLRGGA